MSRYTPRDIAQAACQIVINAGKVPATTISAPSNVGDTFIAVTDGSKFIAESVLTFWDGSGERLMAIDDKSTANTIPFRFPVAPLGLTTPHIAGGQVATNIFYHPLADNSSAFDNGFPVIGCYVLDNTKIMPNSGQAQGKGILTIRYQLNALQADDSRMDSQIWLGQELDRGEKDADDLMAVLEKNFTMSVSVGGLPTDSYVQEVTHFVESRRRNIQDPKKPVFEFFLDCHYEGRRGSIR